MEKYCKVLIIDDEMITRQGLKHIIIWEKEGFQIVGEASNGQEGLGLIKELQPDIVLADIVMPIMDGMDFSLILQEKYPNIQLIILSSYDDFAYVKGTLLNGAVDYVLKPTLSPEILLDALHKAVNNIPGFQLNKGTDLSANQQLARYLSGYDDSLDMDSLLAELPHRQFRIFAIDLKKVCDNNSKQMDRIYNWIRDSYRGHKPYSCLSALITGDVCCWLFNYKKADEEKLLDDINSCVQMIGHMEDRAFFVLSDRFSDFEQIKERFAKRILPRLKSQFYFPGRQLIHESEYDITDNIQRFNYEEYNDYLRSKHYSDALAQLSKYMDYVCDRHFDEYILKNLMKNLLYNLLMEVEKYGFSSDDYREKYFRSIDNTQYVDEFLSIIHSIIKQLQLSIEEEIEKEDDIIIDIRQYIAKHYAEDLDLTQISHQFNFNYHYLSSYFNQHTPEGFSGYLNKIRIDAACDMLKSSDIPISEVGTAVGYTDHSYFCRVFKKFTGLTPSRYRRSNVKE